MGRKSNYSEAYKREAVAKAEASGNVSQTARELGISTKSLHDWIKQCGQPMDIENASVKELSARVRQLERQLALREGGIRTSRKRVERLMRQHGLRSICARKRRIGLTKAGQSAYFAPNLPKQDFKAKRKNEKWVTDTTYIPTREGWLYLVSVMNLFSRQVVGWAMGEQHDADLATAALDMAIQRARPAEGLIVHSDRGGEFANAKFHRRAAKATICLSISSTGSCYDNAAAESFFATVKLEAIPEGIFASQQQARAALFDYIEVFYNRQRLHSGIGFARPVSRAA